MTIGKRMLIYTCNPVFGSAIQDRTVAAEQRNLQLYLIDRIKAEAAGDGLLLNSFIVRLFRIRQKSDATSTICSACFVRSMTGSPAGRGKQKGEKT